MILRGSNKHKREEITIKKVNRLKLKSLRKSNQKTLSDIAKILDIATNSYFYKEEGTRAIKLEEAKVLADFYNVSIEELFFN